MKESITPQAIEKLTSPTKEFLCPLKANKYALQFLRFVISDKSTGKNYYVHEQDQLPNKELIIQDENYAPDMLKLFDQMRHISYNFSDDFLKAKILSSSLVFKVGDLPVKNLQIIDHFFFKDKVIKSYQFKFPFCAPNSINEWEYVYELPQLSPEVVKQMITEVGQTRSETFFFVGDELILHNKADYDFSKKD